MPNYCAKQQFAGGMAFECCRPEFHTGPCNFLFVERASAIAARAAASSTCRGCGHPAHATHNCPEKIGGTE